MSVQVLLNQQDYVKGWGDIFGQEVMSVQKSTRFTKQLTVLAFSSVSYMRGMFPDDAFGERNLGGRTVKLLKGSYSCKDAYMLTRWLKSAFEAVELKYAKDIVLELTDCTTKQLLECYVTSYNYADDEACTMSLNTNFNRPIQFNEKDMQEATTSLIYKLLDITEGLAPLPPQYNLKLRINYFPEKVPTNFKLKFFLTDSGMSLENLPSFNRQDAGSVSTPFHQINFSCYTPKGATDLLMEISQEDILPCTPLAEEDLMEVVPNTESDPMEEETANWSREEESMQTFQKEVATFNCPCGLKTRFGEFFECHHCNTLQHYICYKLDSGVQLAAEMACCLTCSKVDPSHVCTDPTLARLNEVQAKNLAVYRLILKKCSTSEMVSVHSLIKFFKMKETMAREYIERLVAEAFIRPKKNSRELFTVRQKNVLRAVENYLRADV